MYKRVLVTRKENGLSFRMVIIQTGRNLPGKSKNLCT